MEYIAEDIEAVVQSIQDVNGMPFFFKGHRLEVSNKLKLMDTDPVNKLKRYPAIILWMDIKEVPVDTFLQYTLNLSIVAPTKNNVFVETRLQDVIYPVLLPIFDKFIEALGNAGLFFWPGPSLTMPPHTRYIRPYWGAQTPERNRAFYLDDKLDAIDIEGLVLNKEMECKPY